MNCTGDPALDARGHTAVDVTVVTSDGGVYGRQLDIAPGFPGNALSDQDHIARFDDCMRYAAQPLLDRHIRTFLDAVDDLTAVPDARMLVDCLVAPACR